MDENEGVPPSSEIEEDTNFTVHEEEEDEEERIEEEAEDGEETNHAQSAERGLNGSTEESTHQLSIREEPVEARYRRVSPQKRVATGAANATLQTAKRGGASRGRARGRARNR